MHIVIVQNTDFIETILQIWRSQFTLLGILTKELFSNNNKQIRYIVFIMNVYSVKPGQFISFSMSHFFLSNLLVISSLWEHVHPLHMVLFY